MCGFFKNNLPVMSLKSGNPPSRMDYDHRVIIKSLWNDAAEARQIGARLQEQFAEHSFEPRIVQFWIAEIRGVCQDLDNEICSERPRLDDRDSKILAILDKSLFESPHSIAERLAFVQSTVLRYLHESLGFKSFHLRWAPHLDR
jgi:hypothetical protein